MKKTLNTVIALLIASAMLILPSCTGNSDVQTTESTEKSFIFEVVDKDGNLTQTEIETDGQILGEVLQSLGYIDGEEGPYGLYIKKVNGITADYDIDGTYWAFYINGESAMTGADQVEIVDGTTYSFRVETM